MNTEGPLFYYYMFICASLGSKISGFQQAQRRAANDRTRHKSYGGIQYQGHIFPPSARNGCLLETAYFTSKQNRETDVNI